MLDAHQAAQFSSFGFVVLKGLFSPEEVKVLKSEFDHAAKRDGRIEPFDGTKGQNFSMLGEDTPFYSSLPEDPRFLPCLPIAIYLEPNRNIAFFQMIHSSQSLQQIMNQSDLMRIAPSYTTKC